MLNFKTVWDIILKFFSIMPPFIYGFLLAYILNFLMLFFEKRVFFKIEEKNRRLKSLNKTLSLICTYIVAFGIVTFLVAILVPQVSKSFESLYQNMQGYLNGAEETLNEVLEFFDNTFGLNLISENQLNKFIERMVSLFTGSDMQNFYKNILNAIFPAAINTASNIYNWFIAIIVSVYFLACKEKLCAQVKAVSYAYMPKRVLNKAIEIVNVSNNMCGRFLIGKLVDSIIIGILCFIGMSIFRFEYAPLISVIVGFTNIIPVFGPFIGAVPTALIILLVSPMKCLIYVIFIIVLQQIDGNIIGPKILGNSTGINGFWIMFAILLGGGLFGFIGMLLGVPVFVVIYAGLEKLVNDGLKKRGLQTETAEYMDLDYIDDATMRPVRLPKEAPPESLKDTQDGSVK